MVLLSTGISAGAVCTCRQKIGGHVATCPGACYPRLPPHPASADWDAGRRGVLHTACVVRGIGGGRGGVGVVKPRPLLRRESQQGIAVGGRGAEVSYTPREGENRAIE